MISGRIFAAAKISGCLLAFAWGVTAAAAEAAAGGLVRPGLWKTFVFDKPDMVPFEYGGWSRAKDVLAEEYCVYLDVRFADGTADWGLCADFRQGTHDWERASTVYLPLKPVRSVEVYAIMRKGTGRAEFRDFFLRRFDFSSLGYDYARHSMMPFADADEIWIASYTNGAWRYSTRSAPRRKPVPAFPPGVRVWSVPSTVTVTPLTPPPASAAADVRLHLAVGERESAQICLSAGESSPLADVSVEISPLRSAAGARFSGEIKWERVGYIRRKPGTFRLRVHPNSPDELWLPDPLLPAAPFGVRSNSTQGIWLTVRAQKADAGGRFAGTVTLRSGKRILAKVPVSLSVSCTFLPETFGFDTAFSLMDCYLKKAYGERWRQMKRQGWDIMLDHRLNPDDITRTEPPEIDDLLYARSRGMSRFNILNIVPPSDDTNVIWVCYAPAERIFSDSFYESFTARLRPYVEALKRHGLLNMAYLYGFDERKSDYFRGIDRMWRRLKRDFPELPVMTTSLLFHDYAHGRTNSFDCVTTDWYCPVVEHFDFAAAERLRAMGKKVWWYTCGDPYYPYANMSSIEHPPYEGRILLGPLSWKYRQDGFLYWIVNFWAWKGTEPVEETDTFLPSWKITNRFGQQSDVIGLYPGKNSLMPSVRLAHIRDGVEENELLQAAQLRHGRARVENFVGRLVRSSQAYLRDPALWDKFHGELLELCDGKGQDGQR